MSQKLRLFIILTMIVVRGNAATCDSVDLRSEFPKPYDQKNMGWCYAYSASDLVSYKFRKQLNGQFISPLHLGLLQNANYGETFNKEGGAVKEAIKLATHPFLPEDKSGFYRGTCLSGVDQKVLSYQPGRSIRYAFSQLAELKRNYDLSVQTNNPKLFLDHYAILGKDNSPVTFLEASRLKNLLEYSNNRTIGINFLDLFCPSKSRFISQAVQYPISYAIGDEINMSQKVGPTLRLSITKSSQIMDAVHKELDKKNVTSIQYYAGFLTGVSSSARIGEYHASTVVGREQIKGVCHIIVRNSWGDCVTPKGEYRYSKNVSKCNDGNIWIAEEILLKHLDGVTYLKAE